MPRLSLRAAARPGPAEPPPAASSPATTPLPGLCPVATRSPARRQPLAQPWQARPRPRRRSPLTLRRNVVTLGHPSVMLYRMPPATSRRQVRSRPASRNPSRWAAANPIPLPQPDLCRNPAPAYPPGKLRTARPGRHGHPKRRQGRRQRPGNMPGNTPGMIPNPRRRRPRPGPGIPPLRGLKLGRRPSGRIWRNRHHNPQGRLRWGGTSRHPLRRAWNRRPPRPRRRSGNRWMKKWMENGLKNR